MIDLYLAMLPTKDLAYMGVVLIGAGFMGPRMTCVFIGVGLALSAVLR